MVFDPFRFAFVCSHHSRAIKWLLKHFDGLVTMFILIKKLSEPVGIVHHARVPHHLSEGGLALPVGKRHFIGL